MKVFKVKVKTFSKATAQADLQAMIDAFVATGKEFRIENITSVLDGTDIIYSVFYYVEQ